ncbi:hypothetical protein [Cognatishimia maritima]|uniref:Regulator RcnB of Ni and Co efflux n=1 Tax=Cognatishimia maritima TaxID=870908 RepID=A0A1M5JDS7_9RHOB|nr:hypothetical protein [Cognatishimia maritima]SHG38661.1 hypothetical protein SAMN04488044_0624 [Cognatishimia maritima]
MKSTALILSAALAATLPLAGFADPGKGKGNGKHHVKQSVGDTAQFCPPGLAKKDPACIPPGQAKKHVDEGEAPYSEGDVIVVENYTILENPEQYDLDPNEVYYRVGDYIYRVDRDSAEVLDLIGAVTAILN